MLLRVLTFAQQINWALKLDHPYKSMVVNIDEQTEAMARKVCAMKSQELDRFRMAAMDYWAVRLKAVARTG